MARPRKGEEKDASALISLRVPPHLKAAIVARAGRDHRSLTGQIIVAIEQHLAAGGKHGHV